LGPRSPTRPGNRRARPSRSAVRVPTPAAATARDRAAPRPRKARRARRTMLSSMACARRSTSCCQPKMPPSSLISKRRSSRSSLRWARSRSCSRGALRSPRGAWRARTGWPPERGWGPVPQPGGQQAELFEERRYTDGGVGLALIRGGNGTRSFETLLRYRGAAMAEFWRALRTLKALQADARAHAAAEVEAPVRPRAGAPGFAAGPLDRSAAVRKRAKRTQESRDSGQTGPATRASELGRRAVLERPRPRPPAAPAAGPARHSRAARVADRTRDPTPRRLRAGHAARAWRSRASARAPRA
jgi:hypothetical protein